MKKISKAKPVDHGYHKIEKEPSYMIQIGDPKTAKKNILEGLREVIIFMQSYEKFKQIQEEKVVTFAQLENDVKAINSLIENKLRNYFPKGKLKLISTEKEEKEEVSTESEPKRAYSAPRPAIKKTGSELDELESQLKDIESQLQGI